ncbi:unnamed protein product [Vitrella brassicaformis CCMP3155]|uniref:Uncharacterized protein n=1 Tax=Vitrella brassicaformis (strain CCMP3155) TaxID=1169540 RepID=A0A0G4EUA9_VITBC|nr:unnamed protein product [Vitrella brassicaformis CCMP3155]|eukprot:CEM02238.1 unnamed protein product [Vitrella brassicaformis CCMP3155]
MTCRSCHEWLPLSQFASKERARRSPQCVACHDSVESRGGTEDLDLSLRTHLRHRFAAACALGQHGVAKGKEIPTLPKEVVDKVVGFVYTPWIIECLDWIHCTLCSDQFTIHQTSLADHLASKKHTDLLAAVASGSKVPIWRCSADLMRRLRDGLGLTGRFCGPDQVETALALRSVAATRIPRHFFPNAARRKDWCTAEQYAVALSAFETSKEAKARRAMEEKGSVKTRRWQREQQ